MKPVTIHLDSSDGGVWPDLRDIPVKYGMVSEVAYLDAGMQSGLPSVSLRIAMDDGSVVIAQTSVRMFTTIAAAFKGKAQKEGIDL